MVLTEGVLIGYSDNSPSYRVWDPVKGKVLNAGGCKFDEEVGPGWWLGAREAGAGIKTEDGGVQFPDEPSAGEDGNPFPPVLPLPPPPPLPLSDAADEDELPPLVEDDSDNEGGDDDFHFLSRI